MRPAEPELIPARDDLLERLRAAEDAVRARDDFIAIAAHELRSPMSALALRLEALERKAAGTPIADDVQRTRRSVQRYVKRALVLLDVNRLNSGKVRLSPDRVFIADLVREIVEAHSDEAAYQRTTVRAEVDTDAAGIWDPHMIEQILSNLVGNAIKYGAGSPVIVRARCHGGCAEFTVADGGPGIAEEHRARIFEKFERVVGTAPYRSGYGLGLWIVGRMVAAHGGRIEARNAPGGGAMFVVTLPLRPEQKEGQTA